MKRSLPVLTIAMCLPLLASPPVQIEYGNPRELHGVTKVFVWKGNNPAVKEQITALLREGIPALELSESPETADVTFVVDTRPEQDQTIASARAVRQVAATRVRWLFSADAKAPTVAEAVKQVTDDFSDSLRRANPETFGPPLRAESKNLKRPFTRSTAGLKTGMTKKQVRDAVGSPVKIEGRSATMATWWYQTTDGLLRIVFSGDRVMQVQLEERK